MEDVVKACFAVSGVLIFSIPFVNTWRRRSLKRKIDAFAVAALHFEATIAERVDAAGPLFFEVYCGELQRIADEVGLRLDEEVWHGLLMSLAPMWHIVQMPHPESKMQAVAVMASALAGRLSERDGGGPGFAAGVCVLMKTAAHLESGGLDSLPEFERRVLHDFELADLYIATPATERAYWMRRFGDVLGMVWDRKLTREAVQSAQRFFAQTAWTAIPQEEWMGSSEHVRDWRAGKMPEWVAQRYLERRNEWIVTQAA